LVDFLLSYVGGDNEQRYCAVTVQHVEVWREIAATTSTIALILEDDAILVPFFKEKFNRFIYTAIRTGLLKIGPHQCASARTNISINEWINQDPAFVVGACASMQDSSFPREMHNATPRLSTHKERFSRCSHAYILTSCSAQEMIRLIDAKKMRFHILDWLQSYLGEISAKLQPFWLDPPLAYQGSQCTDLDGIPTFGHSTP
jgi:GR25 family glycosyltransferase involved in LPS biosynthesis